MASFASWFTIVMKLDLAVEDWNVFARVQGEAQSRIGIVTAQVPRPSLGLIGLAPNLQRDDRVWRIDAAC